MANGFSSSSDAVVVDTSVVDHVSDCGWYFGVAFVEEVGGAFADDWHADMGEGVRKKKLNFLLR